MALVGLCRIVAVTVVFQAFPAAWAATALTPSPEAPDAGCCAPGSSQSASSILLAMERRASEVQGHTETCEALLWDPASNTRANHLQEWQGIRTEADALQELLGALQSIEPVLSPWQRQARERLVPLVEALQEGAEATIRYLRQGRGGPANARYAEHLDEVSGVALGISRVILEIETSITSEPGQ